ncbi:MAG: 23S rRNA (uracil(1939)-C(5))-methyltransferase RlmD [Bacilli bacterium]|nr:23S rRNA (uracil(1939)-C(5))-methyltransferase RlmD [Bacilli bacterium]
MAKRINVVCSGLNDVGSGLFRVGKKVYSAPNLLPGEEAIVEVEFEKKFNNARVVKILKPSKNRIQPKCDIFEKCGGCQLLHMNNNAQKDFKINSVKDAFKEYNLKKDIDEYISASKIYQYRNKMQVAYRYINNKLVYGFYEEGSHRIIPLNKCIVQSEIQNKIARFILELMIKMKITAYNEDKRTGLLRFVLIKESFKTKEILVVLVTSSNVFGGRNEFVREIRNKFPEVTSIVQNINTRKTSIILGDEERVLYGKGYIEDTILDLKFKISSKTFYQINPEQTIKLYSKAIEYANFKDTDKVIDAYCGVGTIGMMLSKHVREIIGVESNKQSVNNAIINAKENNINNIKFVCDDATNYIFSLAKEQVKIDGLIMDPPRSGSTEVFLESVLKLKPKKIVYVSCNPTTLARDLKVLVKDYEIKKLALVDMFVNTFHIESVVLLEQR